MTGVTILIITLVIILLWTVYLLIAYFIPFKIWPFKPEKITPDPNSELVPCPNASNFDEPLTAEGEANKKKLIDDALLRLKSKQQVYNPYRALNLNKNKK